MHPCIQTKSFVSCALFALSSSVLAADHYEIVNIGTLPGSEFSLINAINNNNQIVGTAYSNGMSAAWSYTEEFGMNQIHWELFDSTTAHDINDQGMVVGSFSKDGATKGFRYQQGFWWYLSPIPGQGESSVYGINNLNQMVGISDFASESRATGWLPILPDTPGFALPNYGPQESSGARKINDSGDSVGQARLAGTTRASIFRNNNTIFDLHGLMPNGTSFSQAFDINQLGWVVGGYSHGNSDFGFVFNLELGLQTVNQPGRQVNLSAINDNGEAVGHDGLQTALVWDQTNGLRDLNTLIDQQSGWNLTSARDINNNGWIIGQGSLNGVLTTYLAKPTDAVPEPATMGLLTLVFAVQARRSLKKKQTH